MNDIRFKPVEWRDTRLYLLDQRALPAAENYIVCDNLDSVIGAIKLMVVRGAPAIGIAAAYGAVLCAGHRYELDKTQWKGAVQSDLDRLAQARPTAVNLAWAVETMRKKISLLAVESNPVPDLLALADQILNDDIHANKTMGELASDCMAAESSKVFSVLTHCNAGSLATGGYGTALGAIRSAWQRGLIDQVYADETRPWFQGARLTAWELQKSGIPVVLNADSAAAWLMLNKNIAWVIVGADRIAANGDVANKIGTYNLAIVARHHNVKVMVVAPTSTIDMTLANGQLIDIEMRDQQELTCYGANQIASIDTNAINPVFDVTPASLIDVIVTEKGVIRQPDRSKMSRMFD